MANFLLIHGAWHGAWCWYKTLPALQALGHKAAAIDLPSHGIDRTPVSDITLAVYGQRVAEAVTRIDGPVHLVGHSMGGAVITEAVQHVANRVESLIHLAAMAGREGELPAAALADDKDAALPANLVTRDDGTMWVNDESLEEVFYHDCPAEDIQLARFCLTPRSAAAAAGAITTPDAVLDGVPRHFIFCEQDRAISLPVQQAICEAARGERTASLNASHSPFFSDPALLAETIARLARD